MQRLRKTFVLSILGLLICTLQARGQTLPAFGHVVIVPLENHSYSQVVGSSSMPHLNSLISKYGLATNYTANTHPSIGNYFMLTTAQILTNDDGQTPSSFPVSADNIARQVEVAGKTWKDYPEKTGSYIVRHDPLQYMTNINSANLSDFSQFATDLANHALPNFSWITPNGCNDAHDCGLSTADSWLQTNIDPLVKSTYFQPGGDGLLIIVFDESSGSGGTNSTGTTAGGQVECVIVSPNIISAGFRSTTRHYHESLLRLMEQGLGLTSFAGSSASANNMSEFFGAGTLPGVVSLSPTAVPFGSVLVGATSAAQVVTLHNGTTSSASISSIAISGTNASAFAQTHTCGSSLAAGASCTISVTFKPATTGAAAATLAVTDSATGSPQTAALTGAGVTSTVSLSPASLTFANQAVGTTSAAQFSTLANSGTTTITVSGETISGDFAFAGLGTCGTSLAPGTSCTISVNFTPTTTGTRTGTVTVNDSATGSPQTITLSGSSGTGTPAVSLSPTALSFGNQTVGTSAAKSITLSNTGTAALSISGYAITGTNGGDFTKTTNCLASLGAGASCIISVTFKPTATGTRSASLAVTDNASGSPQRVGLSGSGVSSSTTGPVVSLSPTSLAFGNQTVGTSAAKSITLSNTGTAALSISGYAITGTNSGDFTKTTNCLASLGAGASCIISVTFKPTATGTRTASVAVTDNATGSPQAAALSGSGVSSGTSTPVASLSPTSLAFGNQTVGTKAAKSITLSNTGTAALS